MTTRYSQEMDFSNDIIFIDDTDWKTFTENLRSGRCDFKIYNTGISTTRPMCRFKAKYYKSYNDGMHFHVSNEERRKILRFLEKE